MIEPIEFLPKPPGSVEITVNELKIWKMLLDEGASPLVAFNHDPSEMLKSAYELRGERIKRVLSKINALNIEGLF